MEVSCMNRVSVLWLLEIIVFSFLISAVFTSVILISRLPFKYQRATSAGKPYMDTHNADFAGEITSVASDESYVYCCFGKRHAVKVFDFSGRYVQTIAISDAHNKGGTLMVSEESGTVVFFSDAHCYTFENGNYVSFDPKGNQRGQLRYLCNTTDPAGNTYTIQQGCIVKQTASGITSRFYASPTLLRLMNPKTMHIAIPLLMACVLILHSMNTSGKKI